MRYPAIVALLAAMVCGCSEGAAPGQQDGTRFDPPNTQFSTELGFTPPVTTDEARAIAEAATGGTAGEVEQETEDGELFYEVEVETSAGRREVEIRASDGGVVEIEHEDDDDDGDDDDEDSDD